ncbi:hypothetical protein V5F44_16575 [Xanthobacter sp. V2C-8]|uniref:hypothetical protein n=1 Tax=Xanthobacter albus TaxID=3119929 RepID=UPI003726D3A4
MEAVVVATAPEPLQGEIVAGENHHASSIVVALPDASAAVVVVASASAASVLISAAQLAQLHASVVVIDRGQKSTGQEADVAESVLSQVVDTAAAPAAALTTADAASTPATTSETTTSETTTSETTTSETTTSAATIAAATPAIMDNAVVPEASGPMTLDFHVYVDLGGSSSFTFMGGEVDVLLSSRGAVDVNNFHVGEDLILSGGTADGSWITVVTQDGGDLRIGGNDGQTILLRGVTLDDVRATLDLALGADGGALEDSGNAAASEPVSAAGDKLSTPSETEVASDTNATPDPKGATEAAGAGAAGYSAHAAEASSQPVEGSAQASPETSKPLSSALKLAASILDVASKASVETEHGAGGASGEGDAASRADGGHIGEAASPVKPASGTGEGAKSPAPIQLNVHLSDASGASFTFIDGAVDVLLCSSSVTHIYNFRFGEDVILVDGARDLHWISEATMVGDAIKIVGTGGEEIWLYDSVGLAA